MTVLSSFLQKTLLIACLPLLVAAPAQASENKYKAVSQKGSFTLHFMPSGETPLNQLLTWEARLVPANEPVRKAFQILTEPTDYIIAGGMPAHGHGLPTDPRVTTVRFDEQGEVILILKGVKFQMWGDWVLSVEVPALQDRAEAAFTLKP